MDKVMVEKRKVRADFVPQKGSLQYIGTQLRPVDCKKHRGRPCPHANAERLAKKNRRARMARLAYSALVTATNKSPSFFDVGKTSIGRTFPPGVMFALWVLVIFLPWMGLPAVEPGSFFPALFWFISTIVRTAVIFGFIPVILCSLEDYRSLERAGVHQQLLDVWLTRRTNDDRLFLLAAGLFEAEATDPTWPSDAAGDGSDAEMLVAIERVRKMLYVERSLCAEEVRTYWKRYARLQKPFLTPVVYKEFKKQWESLTSVITDADLRIPAGATKCPH